MKGVKLPAGATGYLVLGIGAIAAIYVVVKYALPAITNAASGAAKTALNDASQLPATAVDAAGNAVGSTLDAIGNQLLGSSTYNAIPATWGGVWSDIKGWFGGGSTATTSSEDTGASTQAVNRDQVSAANFSQVPDISSTGIGAGGF